MEKINKRISPIQDEYIEKYLAEKELNLTATLNAEAAYKDADFVVIAAPTNYDSTLHTGSWTGKIQTSSLPAAGHMQGAGLRRH